MLRKAAPPRHPRGTPAAPRGTPAAPRGTPAAPHFEGVFVLRSSTRPPDIIYTILIVRSTVLVQNDYFVLFYFSIQARYHVCRLLDTSPIEVEFNNSKQFECRGERYTIQKSANSHSVRHWAT